MDEHVLGLLPGIFLQSIARFGDVDVATNVFERHNLELRAQDLPYLIELMRVVGGENYLHFSANSLIFFFFIFTFISSKPSLYTPMTLLWLTKALGSIILMRRKIGRASCRERV